MLGADEAFFWCSSDYLTTASSNNVDSDGAAATSATALACAEGSPCSDAELACVLWAGGGGPGGGTGMDLLSPTPWLLTYWMGRHHGLLAEPGLVAGK